MKYYISCILPKQKYLRCKSINEFYKLRSRCTVWKEENIELVPKEYLLYSPFSGEYYKRELKIINGDIIPSIETLKTQIKEGNIYFKL